MTAYIRTRLRPSGVCQACRTPVVFDGKRWKVAGERVAHRCEGTRCNAPLRHPGERCARLPHPQNNAHRSAYAMHNENARKRKWTNS